MPAGWVSAQCGSGVRPADDRLELRRGGSWCYNLTCAVQPVSYRWSLFYTACSADTGVSLLRRLHAQQPQSRRGKFYSDHSGGRQRSWGRRLGLEGGAVRDTG